MKKVLICIAAVLALLSCKKSAPDPGAPVITWAANEFFGIQEMGDNMDGKIVISVPSGIGSLQLKCTQAPDLSRVLLSQWIGIQTYKSSLTMDLLSDATLSDAFAAHKIATPAGKDLIRATSCTLDMKALLDAITEGLALDNGARFSFEISASNTAGVTVNKTAVFRWTAAATFPSNIPSIYWLCPDDNPKQEWTITVPGKVAECTISFGGSNADERILNYIKNRSASKTTVIDLVNDQNVNAAFRLDPVIKNAAMVTLKLSGLLQDLGYECSPRTSTDMVITIKDTLGKIATHTVTLIPLTDAEE